MYRNLGGSFRRFRHSRSARLGIGAGSTALLVAAAMSVSGAGAAGADTGPTQGSSYAQALQITPHEGSLAAGAVFGEALAGHTNTFARAQSQSVDFGAVGDSARGYNCGNPPNQYVYNAIPQPFQTESGATGAAGGLTQQPSPSNYGATQFILANINPYGEADTTFGGPVADPNNAFVASGVATKSWSGLLNGVLQAGATSDIGSLSLGGGAVVLKGLHWAATYPIGGSGQPTGSFTLSQAILSGVPLPNNLDVSAVQAAITPVLGTLGLVVQLPIPYVQQGVQFVPPLEIQVVPNATRDSIVDQALVAIQPDYYQIASGLENGFASDKPPFNSLAAFEASSQGQQLQAALCQSDTPITVADIAIAAFSGGGFFSAGLGGVNASTSPLPANAFNLAALGFGDLAVPGSTQFIPGTSAAPSTLGSTGALTTLVPATTPAPTPAVVEQASGARLKGFAPGGPLLAAGLGGLGLLALLIEGDRRMMRRAQRASTREE